MITRSQRRISSTFLSTRSHAQVDGDVTAAAWYSCPYRRYTCTGSCHYLRFGTPWGTFASVTSPEVRSIVLKYIHKGGRVVKPIVVHARRTPRFLSSTSRLGCCRIAINSQFKRYFPKVQVKIEAQLFISSSVDIEAINSTNFRAGRRYIDV